MRSANSSNVLYHISSTPGLTIFMPRRCWFNSGLNLSGMLEDGAVPPDGCHVRNCVFAGDAKLAAYFCVPSKMKRFSIKRTSGGFNKAMIYLGINQDPPGEVLIFEQEDREEILDHTFYVYRLRKADFKQFPSREYVAEKPVVPLSESKKSSPLTEIQKHGIHVAFVADIEDCFSRFLQMNIDLGIVANIEGSITLLQKEKDK